MNLSPYEFSKVKSQTIEVLLTLTKKAASKPTFQLSWLINILYHLDFLETLMNDGGCFPFDLEPSRSRSDYICRRTRIWSFPKIGKIKNPPQLMSALPQDSTKILYFNRFREKPAISKFDQPFTPIHKSSPHFATGVSSVLHYFLKLASTCS